jgi:hypothetical protein
MPAIGKRAGLCRPACRGNVPSTACYVPRAGTGMFALWVVPCSGRTESACFGSCLQPAGCMLIFRYTWCAHSSVTFYTSKVDYYKAFHKTLHLLKRILGYLGHSDICSKSVRLCSPQLTPPWTQCYTRHRTALAPYIGGATIQSVKYILQWTTHK